MAYTPTVWKNGEFPPIDAEHLNKIEQGIVNSAPGGFGLGDMGKWLTPDDNLDEVKTNGWYIWERGNEPKGTLPTSIGQTSYATAVRVWGNGAACYQENVDMTDSDSHGCLCARTIYASTVYPWEWGNPPMQSSIEYRTTERYLGKPVFKYLLNDFEAWRPDGQNGWASAGKAVLFSTEKGGTKNISLETGRTYIFSATNNVFGGVAIVQTTDIGIRAITPLVPLANWKIEAGSGLSVNVTDTDGRYGVTVSAMML